MDAYGAALRCHRRRERDTERNARVACRERRQRPTLGWKRIWSRQFDAVRFYFCDIADANRFVDRFACGVLVVEEWELE